MGQIPSPCRPSLRRSFLVSALAALAAVFSLRPAAAATDAVIVDASEYPWSAIGRINTGGRGFCTGFLVGERTVLTAAHCLYDYREGRWWHESDVHFVAGYQRDAFLAHAKAQTYHVAGSVIPDRNPKIKSAISDWAIIELTAPVGRQTGWLSLRPLDLAAFFRLKKGTALALQAGYRRDRGHVITLATACGELQSFAKGHGLVHRCEVIEGGSGSPLLFFADGGVAAMGLHVLRLQSDSTGVSAAVLNASILHPESGAKGAIKASRKAGLKWGAGQPPSKSGKASPLPVRTITSILARLGYLGGSKVSAVDAAQRKAAIKAFQRRSGLTETGRESIALLARLIRAME